MIKSEVKYWRDVINNEISIVFWPASYEAQTQYPIKNNEVVQEPLNLIEIVWILLLPGGEFLLKPPEFLSRTGCGCCFDIQNRWCQDQHTMGGINNWRPSCWMVSKRIRWHHIAKTSLLLRVYVTISSSNETNQKNKPSHADTRYYKYHHIHAIHHVQSVKR